MILVLGCLDLPPRAARPLHCCCLREHRPTSSIGRPAAVGKSSSSPPALPVSSGSASPCSGRTLLWPNWRASLILVRPATVLAWHRQGFQTYSSRPRSTGRPPIDLELRTSFDAWPEPTPPGAGAGF